MPTFRASREAADQLSQSDQEALAAIYYHRCLNEELLYRYFYRVEDKRRTYTQEHIKALIENKYVKPVEYGAEYPALFLDVAGVHIVQTLLDLPDEETRTAKDLMMHKVMYDHQMALNAVALSFETFAKQRKIPYQYQDDKFMPFDPNVLPDACFSAGQYDFFMEMDMAHERQAELLEKWGNYRSYINSNNYHYKDKKTVVLFFTCNAKRVHQRRNSVLRSVSTGLLDKIDSNFDMYVGEPKVLAQVVFDHLLRVEPPGVKDLQQKLRQFGLTLLSGQGLSAFLPQGAPAYTYYARMLNGQTHGVLVKDGRPQEFLVDVGVPSLPLSCLAKAVCHNGTILNLTTKIGRPVPYLIIVEDEKKLNSDLAAVEARGLKNVYYTTPQRLDASTTLPEALFQIDQLGRIFHFSNYALKEPVYEQTLKTITVT